MSYQGTDRCYEWDLLSAALILLICSRLRPGDTEISRPHPPNKGKHRASPSGTAAWPWSNSSGSLNLEIACCCCLLVPTARSCPAKMDPKPSKNWLSQWTARTRNAQSYIIKFLRRIIETLAALSALAAVSNALWGRDLVQREEELIPAHHHKLNELNNKFRDVFSIESGFTHLIHHEITPLCVIVRQRLYWAPEACYIPAPGQAPSWWSPSLTGQSGAHRCVRNRSGNRDVPRFQQWGTPLPSLTSICGTVQKGWCTLPLGGMINITRENGEKVKPRSAFSTMANASTRAWKAGPQILAHLANSAQNQLSHIRCFTS